MKLWTVILLIALGVQAQAQEKKGLLDQISGQPYGMAGCGAGSMVFANKPGMVQIFAVTTNGISGNQTFGISSGTLNCGESGLASNAQAFIKGNKVALQNDIARGQGETLLALKKVLKCQNSNFDSEINQAYKSEISGGSINETQLTAIAFKSCEI